MHSIILAAFVVSRVPAAMCAAGVVIFLIGIMAAKSDIAGTRGLDKIVALSNLCFAVPLAVFGALHLTAPQGLLGGVPAYMPWRMF